MKKKVLIISPYFPPLNTADMQRVRMSLPYFAGCGWDAEVVAVHPDYTDLPLDHLLVESLPPHIKVHWVKALNKGWTSKIGFGSIAYRSLWFIKQRVNALLKQQHFDLIYFSTTQFQVCILGPYWKKRFNIPYAIDMQDAWHSDYYEDKPKEQRPPKYWLSYRINKMLEPIAMNAVGGIISVSESYVETLKTRYPRLKSIPSKIITFGAFAPDILIAIGNQKLFPSLLSSEFTNIVYIGRGGIDMHDAIVPVFEVCREGLITHPEEFRRFRFYFIGTSYAPNGQGLETIMPLARQYGLEENVIEVTSRIGYYHTLNTLNAANALFVPGSNDPEYTASKIYPYLLTRKPLLAIFNSNSSAITILKEFGVRHAYSYDNTPALSLNIGVFLSELHGGNEMSRQQQYLAEAETKYSAQVMTQYQCELFNNIKFIS